MPAVAINCDPAALAKSSVCFCLSEPDARAATLYLLNSISGLNLTPEQLVTASKCFCMEANASKAAELYLLCAIANK